MSYEEAKADIYTKTGYPLMMYIADDDIQNGLAFIKEETNCDD